MKLDNCLCCNSPIKNILDWGLMPLANNYNVKELFPLKLNLCNSCHHLQLDETVDPEIMFKDYPYFSGTSKTAIDYFNEFADIAMRYSPEAKNVLDIACNDGTQLDSFKSLGLKTYGIDPAENLKPVAEKKGHKIKCEMFPESNFKMTHDIIVCQNVVAHVPNPLEFIKGCKDIMHDDSLLMIATSQANMILNTEFDTIYHEHISYFNTESMQRLCNRAGLYLEDVFTNPIHGTSYIFVIRRGKKQNPVEKRVDFERVKGLQDKSTYDKWVNDCEAKANKVKDKINKYREEGYLIVGCGAAAKGITFLNMSKTAIDCLVDTTPAKWYSKAGEVMIYPFEWIKSIQDKKVLFVILAWNFKEEIVENVLRFRNNDNDVFITTNEESTHISS